MRGHRFLHFLLLRGQLHIAGCTMDMDHSSIHGNWQGMRVGYVKDLQICHGSPSDRHGPEGQVYR